MSDDRCPLCDADLQGDPIPQEFIDKGYSREGATHYSRVIGIYDWGLDRTIEWMCPECKGRWPR